MEGKQKARLAISDTQAFNSVMMRYEVCAFIPARNIEELKRSALVFPESVCIYKISIYGSTTYSEVMKYEKEIKSEIALARKKIDCYDKNISIRFDTEPFFSLEVDAPLGYVLERPSFVADKFCSHIGMQYSTDGARVMNYSLLHDYQTLVAAVSGGGKSVLLRNCIIGLTESTPPEELKMILIDLKNDDLAEFKGLPHVSSFSWKLVDAVKVITKIKKELDTRIASDLVHSQKILLVVDELGELKEVDETLSSIMKLGRSLGIFTLMATQYPTSAQIGVKVARAFTRRFVGRVDSASSALWATGVAGSGAELLRKPGSFLSIRGADIERFQVFSLSGEK